MIDEAPRVDTGAERQIRSWQMAGLAFAFLISNLGRLIAMLFQAVLLAGAVVVVVHLATSGEVPTLIADFVFGFALAPVSVAVHRAIVLKAPLAPSSYFSAFLQKRVWRFLAYSLLLATIWGGLIMVSIIPVLVAPEPSYAMLYWLAPLCFGVGTAIVVRLAFVLPAVATDQYSSMKESWALMRGFAWRTFGAVFIVGVPGGILVSASQRIDNLGVLAALSVLSILWVVLPSAVLSFAYNRATA